MRKGLDRLRWRFDVKVLGFFVVADKKNFGFLAFAVLLLLRLKASFVGATCRFLNGFAAVLPLLFVLFAVFTFVAVLVFFEPPFIFFSCSLEDIICC